MNKEIISESPFILLFRENLNVFIDLHDEDKRFDPVDFLPKLEEKHLDLYQNDKNANIPRFKTDIMSAGYNSLPISIIAQFLSESALLEFVEFFKKQVKKNNLLYKGQDLLSIVEKIKLNKGDKNPPLFSAYYKYVASRNMNITKKHILNLLSQSFKDIPFDLTDSKKNIQVSVLKSEMIWDTLFYEEGFDFNIVFPYVLEKYPPIEREQLNLCQNVAREELFKISKDFLTYIDFS